MWKPSASLPIINEQLKDFKEDKNLVMYCTGGIRCEKASAYFKHQGFKNVFQLEGGIINYARQIKEQNLESKFIGKTLSSIIDWAKESPTISFPNATNAVNLAIITPTAPTTVVICYSSNVTIVKP